MLANDLPSFHRWFLAAGAATLGSDNAAAAGTSAANEAAAVTLSNAATIPKL